MHSIKATCVCGFSFDTRSTNTSLKSEICSHCHPFCTGSQKFVDSAGRIERFEKKFKKTEAKKAKK